MFPYKTRFQTDFEVDWGRTYPKATPPVREKRELQLFDIREFVKEKKREKMEAMGVQDNPFGGVPGGNPFMSNPFMQGVNPFAKMPNILDEPKSQAPEQESFNIDDLVKKIDAKIAEIEKEEEAKSEEESKSLNDLIPNKVEAQPEAIPSEVENQTIEVPEVNNTVEAPKVSTPPINKDDIVDNMYEDNTDDDDFFDDFFSDE